MNASVCVCPVKTICNSDGMYCVETADCCWLVVVVVLLQRQLTDAGWLPLATVVVCTVQRQLTDAGWLPLATVVVCTAQTAN